MMHLYDDGHEPASSFEKLSGRMCPREGYRTAAVPSLLITFMNCTSSLFGVYRSRRLTNAGATIDPTALHINNFDLLLHTDVLSLPHPASNDVPAAAVSVWCE
jgi:hypothetical protein